MISLNPNRFLTRGVERSLFVDLNGELRLIPNELVDYVYKKTDNITKNLIEIKYFEKFLKKEMFLVMNALEYEAPIMPYDINILVIELELLYDEAHLFRLLKNSIFGRIVFKVKSESPIDHVFLIRRITESTDFSECAIYFEKKVNITELLTNKLNEINNLTEIYLTRNSTICESNKLNFDVFKKTQNTSSLMFIEYKPSKDLLVESAHFNTYLNKKMFVKKSGKLMLSEDFGLCMGNITEDSSLRVFIEKAQQFWNLTKDQIDICNTCELRKVCLDFREPFKRKNNSWYHKIECNYNPYIAKWEGEDGYLNLAECGVISNETEFSIDHEKIAEINAKLWQDE